MVSHNHRHTHAKCKYVPSKSLDKFHFDTQSHASPRPPIDMYNVQRTDKLWKPQAPPTATKTTVSSAQSAALQLMQI